MISVRQGLKNKLCKCNFPKNIYNTKNAAKSGNAEERPNAGCEIKRWKAAAEMSSFSLFHRISPKRINLGSLRAAPSTAVRLLTCPQRKSQTASTQVPSLSQAWSISLKFPFPFRLNRVLFSEQFTSRFFCGYYCHLHGSVFRLLQLHYLCLNNNSKISS